MRAEEIARPARRRRAEASRRGCGWQTELGLAEPRRQARRVLQAQGAGAGRRCRAAWPGGVGNSWNTTCAGSGRAGSVFFTAPYVLGDLVGVASLIRVFGKLGRMLPSARGYCWSQDSWGRGDERASRTPAGLLPTGEGAPCCQGLHFLWDSLSPHRRKPPVPGSPRPRRARRDPLETSGPARALRPARVLGNDGGCHILSTYSIPGAFCAASPTLTRTLQAGVIIPSLWTRKPRQTQAPCPRLHSQ